MTGAKGLGSLTSWTFDISPSLLPVSTEYSGPPPYLNTYSLEDIINLQIKTMHPNLFKM